MKRKILLTFFVVFSLFSYVLVAQAAPRFATPLIEGRTYDQAHNSGKIDWSGSINYENLFHRDGTSLPPSEGGASCGGGCTENVTKIGNGATVSGSFARDVTYFEAMLAYEYQGTGVGSATIHACGSSLSVNLRKAKHSAAGFNSFIVSVPAGCRTWSVTASGGFAHFRSVDALYVAASPPTVSGSVHCDTSLVNGWCPAGENLVMTASDPQNYAVTISGTIGATHFSCASGYNCAQPLPEGVGNIVFWATSTANKTSTHKTASWKRDVTDPTLSLNLPAVDGNNGWYVSAINVGASASDALSGVASKSISINGGTAQSPPVTLSDGVYNVSATATDNAGNSHTVPATVKIDTVAPGLHVSVDQSPNSDGWYTTHPTLSVSGTDAGSGVTSETISVDGGTAQSGGVTLSDGIYTVVYVVKDVAGNSRSVTRTYKVDATGPVLTPSYSPGSPNGDNGWYVSGVDVDLGVSEPTSGIIESGIRVNGGALQAPIVSLSDGIHPLTFYALNGASLTTTETAIVKVDTVAPGLHISVDQTVNSSGWYTVHPTVSVSGTDTGSGVESETVKVDGSLTGSSAVLTDGIHTVVYTVKDVAENFSSSTKTYKVDATGPVLSPGYSPGSPNGDNGWYTSNVDVDLGVSEPTSGIVESGIRVNGGTLQAPIVSLSDGVHPLTFYALNGASLSTTETSTVKVDTIAPVPIPDYPVPDGANGWHVSDVQLSLDASDATSGIASKTININGTNRSNPATISDGTYTVLFTTVDKAGLSASRTVSFKVDTIPPLAQFVEAPADGNSDWHVTQTTVSAQYSDGGSGIASTRYRLNGGTWLPGDSVDLLEGIFDVEFSVFDVAGNETVTQKTVHVDLTPPVSVFTSHSNGDVVSGVVNLVGKTIDATSGSAADGEISLDNSVSWQPITLDHAGNWSATWDTYALPNGDYTLLMRGEDIAGNPEHTATLILTVRNDPPSVDLKPGKWSISESGTLKVSENGIEIAKVFLVFRDPEGRYPKQKIELRPQPMTGTVTWDRRFGDGTIAPWGEYEVMAVACDIFDNCARDTSIITIPWYALTTPTPIPTLTATPIATEVLPTTLNTPTSVAIMPTPLPTLPPAPLEPPATVDYSKSVQNGLIISAVLGYLLLLLTLLLALDPRPKALNKLSETGRIWIDLQTKEK